MKRTTFLALLAGMMLASCSSSDIEEPQNDEMEVTLYFTRFQIEQSAMTRTATDVSEYVTHLDIWISDGTTTTTYNQSTSDTGFGSISLTLNKQKQYTIYAVAHKANGAAMLSDGVISFPEDKVTHSFFYSDTFTPTNGMQKVCSMNRIVAQFQFNATDAVPDWCKTMRFTISGVYNKWSVTTGAYNQLDRVSTFNNFSTRDDGTVTFNIYAIVTDEATNHTVLVEALNEGGEVVESHLFENVPLRNNYRTIATGNFFTDAASSFSFVAEEWAGDVEYAF